MEKAMNDCVSGYGLGKVTHHLEVKDYFVLTRILNHAELCFNQRPKYDFAEPKHRFFQKDARSHWVLQPKNECFICDRYSYTQITYERGVIALNHGLEEIQDQEILKKLNYHYKKNQLEFRNKAPLICGTVIQKRYPNSCNFERRLKMIRAQVFGLLSVVGSKDFSDDWKHLENIKDGCQKYLIQDDREMLNILKIEKCFQGWQFIVNDMALNNELTDIKIINFPNLASHNINNQDFFVFAEFLKPGYHQILIYDPEIDRAFVKDFMVHLNQRDFVYPEYPFPVEKPIQKIIPNMWRQWKEDSDEQLAKSFQTDLDSDQFEIEKFIKNPEDQNECLDILKSKIRGINLFQKSLMIRSVVFPQISWDAVLSFIDEVQQSPKFMQTQSNHSFQRAHIELTFIRATRTDKTKGLASAMQRSELLDFLMRMAQQFSIMKYSAKEKVSDHLDEFFEIFIDPILNKSPVLKHRDIIRKSEKLNELLYDNNKALVLLFDQTRKAYGENKTFTKECAKIIFLGLDCLGDNRYSVNERKVFDCFVFSMMTIYNEHKNMTKYSYLNFVEFQELLCRIALNCYQEYETIEWKVFWLLQLVFDHQYFLKNWDPEKIKLVDLVKIR